MPGGVSEWLKETGCKPVGSAYAGSNPAPTTRRTRASRRPPRPAGATPYPAPHRHRTLAPRRTPRHTAAPYPGATPPHRTLAPERRTVPRATPPRCARGEPDCRGDALRRPHTAATGATAPRSQLSGEAAASDCLSVDLPSVRRESAGVRSKEPASEEPARGQFADNLRRHRERLGLSQEELADVCKLHRTEISLLERRKRSPRLETIVILARGLGLADAGELLRGIG
jgi:ribosome-binding protein aMBF1 (putative translation factor)